MKEFSLTPTVRLIILSLIIALVVDLVTFFGIKIYVDSYNECNQEMRDTGHYCGDTIDYSSGWPFRQYTPVITGQLPPDGVNLPKNAFALNFIFYFLVVLTVSSSVKYFQNKKTVTKTN